MAIASSPYYCIDNGVWGDDHVPYYHMTIILVDVLVGYVVGSFAQPPNYKGDSTRLSPRF